MAVRRDDAASGRPASVRYAWGVVLLAAWLVVGIQLVARADNLGLVEDIAFSPYHVPGYVGLAVAVVVVLVSISRTSGRGQSWRDAFPRNYSGLALGTAAAVAWIVVDIAWRATLGIGPGIEGALSPSRLLLPVAIGLIASGPVLDALPSRQASRVVGTAGRVAGVAALALIAATVAAVGGFHPAANVWAERASDVAGDSSEIWVMGSEGARQTRLLAAPGKGVDYSLPVWSPDGARIAYTQWANANSAASNRATDEQTASVWTMAADGTDRRVVVEATDSWAWIPAWSPDGQWLL